ncbi:DNA polymerase ligase N-terminal domain-containing protein [Pseudonocardia acaciae]|uniref:DNA polymerase ligase N-terminal domain-containing protein n=1 Tax=Pseudonocardia acaciae TaxID=551276 RepID=UPI00048ABCF4|nr:DNA polymerase ligase N-terminal domain-containing protein [Pseudonocardia acaciae]
MPDLSDYRSKRDTRRSGEPSGSSPAESDRPRFVVQRHDASSLHFDFRLEIDGVLVSWAVPKGPSADPSDKRLATRTEDHPLDYLDFEGRIPEGEYGAGTVIVWDTGPFDNLGKKDLSDGLADGHLKVRLHGRKMAGGYALTHTKLRGDDRNWLLVKVDDGEAERGRHTVEGEPESVLSGRANEDL